MITTPERTSECQGFFPLLHRPVSKGIPYVYRSKSCKLRDNDLIYLQPITSPANLPPINAYQLVNTNVPPEIEDPISALHEDQGGLGRPLFQTLVPYGVHLAISVYEDRKDSLIRDEVEAKIDELDAIANRYESRFFSLPPGIPERMVLTREWIFRHVKHTTIAQPPRFDTSP